MIEIDKGPISDIVKVARVRPELKWGEQKWVVCPLCGDAEKHGEEKTMNFSRSSVNGHLWVKCEKCGFFLCE